MNEMIVKNYQELELGGEMFEKVREDFDLLFQKLFKKMQDSNSDEGSIDLKLSITINEQQVEDADGGTVTVKMPIIKHKVSTQVPVKDAVDGTADVGMALVYDESLKRYVMKYVSLDGQTSIFDEDMQAGFNARDDDEDSGEDEIEEVGQIPGDNRYLGYTEPENGDSDEDNADHDNYYGDDEKNGAGDDDWPVPDDYGYDEPC